MAGQSGYVYATCDIVRVTERAVLIEWRGEQIWIPKACIADAERLRAGWTNVTVSVTDRMAREKGLEGDE